MKKGDEDVLDDSPELMEHLRAWKSPMLPRLTASALARLQAYLKRPLSLSRLQRDAAYREQQANLKEILHYNRLLAAQQPEPAPAAPQKKRGRPVDTDPKADQQVLDAWNSRAYLNYAELANAFDTTPRMIALAIQRAKLRIKRDAERPT
jgi:hypothetical protein